MDLDLMKYRQMIAKRLQDNVRKQSEVDKHIETGGFCDSDSESSINIDDIRAGRFNFAQGVKYAKKESSPLVKPPRKIVKKKLADIIEIKANNNNDHIPEGGKFHFVKSLNKAVKSIGNEGAKDLKTGANLVKQEVIKQGAKEAGQYLYSGMKEAGKDFMTYAPEVAEGAATTAAENPELMLLAAGMKEKKPRKKRNLSESEKQRHSLIKQYMQKYGVSLPEASSMLKKKNGKINFLLNLKTYV